MEALLEYDLITGGQHDLLYNILSFAFAAFLAGAIGFFVVASQLRGPYRLMVTIAGIVALVASYHYLRIFQSWEEAYAWTEAGLVKTAAPFNVAYRYADWLLTVPLLMIELVDVLRLPHGRGRRLAAGLGVAAVVMIALGYPGEVSEDPTRVWTFWVLSMLPFLVIFGYLVTRYSKHVKEQPEEARGYISAARWLTAGVWWVYPILYLVPVLGWTNGAAVVTINAAFAIADLVAKVGLGIFITAAAIVKDRLEYGVPEERRAPVYAGGIEPAGQA